MTVAMQKVDIATVFPLQRPALSLVSLPFVDAKEVAAAWTQRYDEIRGTHVSTIWSADFKAPLKVRGRDPRAAMLAALEDVVAEFRPSDEVITEARRLFCFEFDNPREIWLLLTIEEG